SDFLSADVPCAGSLRACVSWAGKSFPHYTGGGKIPWHGHSWLCSSKQSNSGRTSEYSSSKISYGRQLESSPSDCLLFSESCFFLQEAGDRKSTRLNSSHLVISYAVFCLKKKKNSRCKASSRIANLSSQLEPALSLL